MHLCTLTLIVSLKCYAEATEVLSHINDISNKLELKDIKTCQAVACSIYLFISCMHKVISFGLDRYSNDIS